MSSSQGWFESDDDYQDRIAQEADERTIEESSGSSPSQGFFESSSDYRDRISQEANENRIEDSSGSAPSQRWLESSDDYRNRIHQEANESIIEDATGVAPSQGWFENENDYDVRVRREANEHIVDQGSDSSPAQGWFEGAHAYRSRIAHEARELRARKRETKSFSSESYQATSNQQSGFAMAAVGCFIAAAVAVMLVVVVVGAFILIPKMLRDPEAEARARELEQARQTVAALVDRANNAYLDKNLILADKLFTEAAQDFRFSAAVLNARDSLYTRTTFQIPSRGTLNLPVSRDQFFIAYADKPVRLKTLDEAETIKQHRAVFEYTEIYEGKGARINVNTENSRFRHSSEPTTITCEVFSLHPELTTIEFFNTNSPFDDPRYNGISFPNPISGRFTRGDVKVISDSARW